MTIRTRTLVASLLAVVIWSPAASAADDWPALTTTPMSAEDAADVDAKVAEAMSEVPDLPGMWIGVWDPDKGSYLQAYGEAVKDGAKATIDDHGRIGSVTKTFTTTAILQQVAEGDLSLDSTIADVLPELATKYPDIADVTVRQLAGMHSPIQDYANTGAAIPQVAADPQRVFTADELIDAGMSLPLQDPEVGGYSTTNTIILGQMLEELTGKPVEEVVTDVAREVGLTETALQPPDHTAMPEPASNGYVGSRGAAMLAQLGLDISADADVTDWTVSWGGAGGGMYSTVADLGKWAATGLGTSLLPADVAAERLDFRSIPEGDYGLGVFDFGNGWIGHTGQLVGWEALVIYNRETGAAFTAIVNDTGDLDVAEVVAYELLPDLGKLIGL